MSEVIKIKSKGIKQGASNLPKDIDSRDLAEQERERFEQDTKQRKSLVVWMIVVVSIWACLYGLRCRYGDCFVREVERCCYVRFAYDNHSECDRLGYGCFERLVPTEEIKFVFSRKAVIHLYGLSLFFVCL